ncbi:hypothetical protein [Desulfosporosinus sp. SB140]|uniref:hypothetical protein n=1 Tax=Desulfosporosinus paludis TaxID=3115649 RepID=UPI00388D1A4E
MIVHLERGSYLMEWLKRFIDTAVQRGINKLYLLEHSHRFIEFKGIYDDGNYDSYLSKWLETKMNHYFYTVFQEALPILYPSISNRWYSVTLHRELITPPFEHC